MDKILIIDDDPDTINLMQAILKKRGYQIATALQETQAYQQLNQFQPDLILLDVLLSGVDGRIICQQIKNDEHLRHIPVIIFSGHPGAQRNIKDFGADDFLAKPFREQDLLEKIQNHFPKKQQSH